MTEGKHTPGPWFVNEAAGETEIAAVEPFKDVGCVYTRGPAEKEAHARAKATARHIVRCVNLHDEMLRALKAAQNGFRSYQYGNSAPALAEHLADHIDTIIAKAEASQ